jgi:hypothetical protein
MMALVGSGGAFVEGESARARWLLNIAVGVGSGLLSALTSQESRVAADGPTRWRAAHAVLLMLVAIAARTTVCVLSAAR